MSESTDTALVKHVETLALSDVDAPSADSNPWQDQALPNEERDPQHIAPIDHTLHLSGFAARDTHSHADERAHVEEVLNEFDPLANREEQAAREAWADADSHPPPNAADHSSPGSIDRPPAVPSKAPTPGATSSAARPIPAVLAAAAAADPSEPSSLSSSLPSSTTFPALAALARSFSIGIPRQRPRSLDTASAVPSPTTISSYAVAQTAPASKRGKHPGSQLPPPPPDEDAQGGSLLGASEKAGTSSDRERDRDAPPPRPGKDREKDKDKEQTFDFQQFLDQMKLKGAEPVAKYLRSFLSNFAKRTFAVHDQVKLIHDFLNFISVKMRETDVWRTASDVDFDNSMEGMEKLVMNRLYDYTFTPHIAASVPPRPVTSDDLERDRVLAQRIALFGWINERHLDIPEGDGSQGFMMFAEQELLKINHYKAPRDKLICVLNCCKVIFGLIRHLHREEGADSFLPILIFVVLKANPEHLLSNVEFINRFRNPEKLQSEAGYYLSSLMGAVSFIETMDHTSLSNITAEEFESNVEAAIQTLPPSGPQTPDLSDLDSPISPRRTPLLPLLSSAFSTPNLPGFGASSVTGSAHTGEEAAQPLSLSAPALGLGEDARRLLQKTGDSISKPLNAIGRIFTEVLDGGGSSDAGDGAGGGASGGKMSYFPGPFAPFELGRESRQQQQQQQQAAAAQQAQAQAQWPHTPAPAAGDGAGYGAPLQTPYKPRVRRTGSAASTPPQTPPLGAWSPGGAESPLRSPGGTGAPFTHQPLALGPSQPLAAGGAPWTLPRGPAPAVPPRMQAALAGVGLSPSPSHGQSQSLSLSQTQSAHVSRTPTPALDYVGMQAEIDAAHSRASAAARATLVQIFPTMEGEVVDMVLEANGGDLGRSIEALLEMSAGD